MPSIREQRLLTLIHVDVNIPTGQKQRVVSSRQKNTENVTHRLQDVVLMGGKSQQLDLVSFNQPDTNMLQQKEKILKLLSPQSRTNVLLKIATIYSYLLAISLLLFRPFIIETLDTKSLMKLLTPDCSSEATITSMEV